MADMRLIDANEALRMIKDCQEDNPFLNIRGQGEVWRGAHSCAIDCVNTCPTVDAAPVVHGRWVGTQYDGYADGYPVYDLWECSECREEYESEGDPPPYNYCPNCGAKMNLEV